MYLSRLTLDLRHSDGRAWVSDCHAMHRAVMTGFGQAAGPEARSEFGVLYRVEDAGPALQAVQIGRAHV